MPPLLRATGLLGLRLTAMTADDSPLDRALLRQRARRLAAGIILVLAVPAALIGWRWDPACLVAVRLSLLFVLMAVVTLAVVEYEIRRPRPRPAARAGDPWDGVVLDPDPVGDLDIGRGTATYRPTWPHRIVLILGWPGLFSGTILIGWPVLASTYGPWVAATALPIAVFLAWGWARCWRVRVEVGPDRILAVNLFRDHDLALRPDLAFGVGALQSTPPRPALHHRHRRRPPRPAGRHHRPTRDPATGAGQAASSPGRPRTLHQRRTARLAKVALNRSPAPSGPHPAVRR